MTIFSAHDSKVNSFYLAFYGRPADPAGLKFWSKQLADNNGDLGAITEFFAASEEAQVRFGTDSVAERIAEIYQQLFNRAPEAAGLAFWTKAIENGHASMADVAVSILKGAQGTDAGLASLRQQAVDAFTAQVEAEGSLYDGYASIDAARILVRAVTADASADDLAALVKAAVSFADTATKTPQVVEAIAINTTLLALFDTARGKSEPVALAQALANTAKAAAGDPVTLESLLRGGGMDKVLKVMPAKASLQDVVKALAEGGLPAAVDVVYPPVVTPTPAPTFKLTFDSVSQGLLDTNKTDKVTNVEDATVKFKYSGNLNGKTLEYSTDGGAHWQTKYLTIDSANRLIVIDDVQLAPYYDKRSSDVSTLDAPGNHITSFVLRATDSNGKVVSGSAKLEYDGYAATPQAVFDTTDTIAELYPNGIMTNDREFTVEHEEGAIVEYKAVIPQHGRGAPWDGEEGWSTVKPILEEGYNAFVVRQTDAAGNRSDAHQVVLALDTVAPKTKPEIALADAQSGSSNKAANTSIVNISNLDIDAYSGWQYSIDGGAWVLGARIYHGTTADFDLAELGLEVTSGSLRVRQIDAAGNIGQASDALDFVIDPAPAPKVTATPSSAGIELSTTRGGELNMVNGIDVVVVEDIHGESNVKADKPVSIGAQDKVSHGVLAVKSSADDSSFNDEDGQVYSLGTNGKDKFSAQYGWGFDGDDILSGTKGDDRLYGGNGDDRLDGKAGDDYLDGGAGADILTGGRGADTFVIAHAGDSVLNPLSLDGYDTITDFSVADGDVIEFASGMIAEVQRGVTISTTFYASLDQMLVDVSTYLSNSEDYGGVFAGQVGRDVYLASLGADGQPGLFKLGSDPLVRLQNTSVLDLDVTQFVGFTGDTHLVGDQTVIDLTEGDDEPTSFPEHAVYVRGFDGNDVLFGSMEDDIFIGGKGGDMIVTVGGRDTVVIGSAEESNGATFYDTDLSPSFDMVAVDGYDPITLVLGQHVGGVNEAPIFWPEVDSADEMFAALTTAYQNAGGTENTAVAFHVDSNYVLLLDNGDGKIDASDVAVLIVGSGEFGVDGNGNVTFLPLVD